MGTVCLIFFSVALTTIPGRMRCKPVMTTLSPAPARLDGAEAVTKRADLDLLGFDLSLHFSIGSVGLLALATDLALFSGDFDSVLTDLVS